jgi:glycosyltransferase involved in cell wall biosynthesis
MTNIVFVLHEASRTGAPFTQLHLMRWLKRNTDYRMMLVLLRGGDLVEEFAELAEVVVVQTPYVPQPIGRRIRNRIVELYRPTQKHIFNTIKGFKPDLLFANTAAVVEYASKLKVELGVKLVSYLHELEITFYHISPQDFAVSSRQVDEFIMGSATVSNYYQKNFAVPAEKAHVIYDFIASANDKKTLVDIRTAYNIASHTQIVGGMASLDWRKGPELFIEVARRVLKTNLDVCFIWVGGKQSGIHYKEIARDVRKLGLEKRLIMAGEQVDIHSFYDAFSVFLLTSREDPFPLVCLESALAYTPIVCFAEAGGMPEFVQEDAGAVVPYLDLDKMAEKVVELLSDKAMHQRQAQVAHDRVLQMCTIDVAGPQIVKLIEATLAAHKLEQ